MAEARSVRDYYGEVWRDALRRAKEFLVRHVAINIAVLLIPVPVALFSQQSLLGGWEVLMALMAGLSTFGALMLFVLVWCLISAPVRLEASMVAAGEQQRLELVELRNRAGTEATRQADAGRYSGAADHGYSLLNRWRNAPTDDERFAASHEARNEWLTTAREDLRVHYGDDVALRLTVPPVEEAPLGTSEWLEHEARVRELRAIIQEIRAGQLRKRVL